MILFLLRDTPPCKNCVIIGLEDYGGGKDINNWAVLNNFQYSGTSLLRTPLGPHD